VCGCEFGFGFGCGCGCECGFGCVYVKACVCVSVCVCAHAYVSQLPKVRPGTVTIDLEVDMLSVWCLETCRVSRSVTCLDPYVTSTRIVRHGLFICDTTHTFDTGARWSSCTRRA